MIDHAKFEMVVHHLRTTFPVQNVPFCVQWNIGTKTARIGLGVQMKHAVDVSQLGGMSVAGIVSIIADMFPLDAASRVKYETEQAIREYQASKRDIMSPAYCGPDGWTGD